VKNYRWTRAVPFLVRAMVLADKTLFLAGPPDEANPQDLSAALEGQRGGSLQAVSAENGNTLAEHRLDSPPVFDGLAAADGRLYMAAQDGQVLCLGKVD
jgi:hypothetical protein